MPPFLQRGKAIKLFKTTEQRNSGTMEQLEKHKRIKRLKIVEQIISVLFMAVVVPLVISAIIINNINQHAVRNELRYSALIISESIASNIETFFQTGKDELDGIVVALKYIKSDYAKDVYLRDILLNSEIFRSFELIQGDESTTHGENSLIFNEKTKSIEITEKINDSEFLRAVVNLNLFDDKVFNIFKKDNRQIYVLNRHNELVISHNYNEKDFNRVVYALPKNLKTNEASIFGKVKNQPLSYYKLSIPEMTIIVNTTQHITKTTINTARIKIISALLCTALFIFIVVLLYTYYLYINIRQLFKGIMALSKGNYKRKIRLLTNVFTPYEIIFLAVEFNKMSDEINNTYRQLKHKNKELKKLDEFRSNLIDTVSHEFRTPLTSIKGYTSRLLRQDIELDEEMKLKSLKIIKNQSERLSRMVEDLLVIPDIEGAKLSLNIEPINLNELVSDSLLSLKNKDKHELVFSPVEDFPLVLADKDRLEQVLINLNENAIKYADDDTPVNIELSVENHRAVIKVVNKADYIQPEVLNKLFGKFMRVDDKTTRTTRGTGLGLFIVKGLVLAMNGSIELKSSKDNVFTSIVKIPLA